MSPLNMFSVQKVTKNNKTRCILSLFYAKQRNNPTKLTILLLTIKHITIYILFQSVIKTIYKTYNLSYFKQKLS